MRQLRENCSACDKRRKKESDGQMCMWKNSCQQTKSGWHVKKEGEKEKKKVGLLVTDDKTKKKKKRERKEEKIKKGWLLFWKRRT